MCCCFPLPGFDAASTSTATGRATSVSGGETGRLGGRGRGQSGCTFTQNRITQQGTGARVVSACFQLSSPAGAARASGICLSCCLLYT